ncbi:MULTISPECIES: HAMP domain-containing sensor histidine kinase [unclassified Ensifer]|uniref:sensor histidine kinase n=1 Tax=unclassified Ensifer TaxID=2633371 RepID=UPI00070C4993|nr:MULTISPECIES: HAMP domain-containing sensor histidine kinase [unclassified Ensifer]KRD60562.1 ATPase [Ensifer sp. Root278]MBV7518577.1 HAMP domain-containing histidine kinase [Ensifer sp. ENS12]
MSGSASHSFKWRLVGWLVLFETVATLVVIAIAVGLLWVTGYLIDGYENGNVDVLKDAITRNQNGDLVLQETPDLTRLRQQAGNIWFIVRDKEGYSLSEGEVPDAFAFATAGLEHMNDARFRLSPDKNARPEAVVKWLESPAGSVQIFSGTEGELTLSRLLLSTTGAFLTIFVPMLLLLAFATVVVTPIVVRRMLSGLSHAASHAAHIEYDQRGIQMPVADVPSEFLPLVTAVNDALVRLDDGYTRHKRFLAQAAHELRTPVAILGARIASLPPGPDKTRLNEDVTRLSILAGQLLDLERLDAQKDEFRPVDLAALAERVIVALAPLAFGAGYEMTFEADQRPVMVTGDEASLERALTNLVQNAIDHGGRRGTITVKVDSQGSIDVCDDGDGIPRSETDKIFEPFQRLRKDGKGAGLGLNLVQKIAHLHGGYVDVARSASGGACMRIVLPLSQGVEA